MKKIIILILSITPLLIGCNSNKILYNECMETSSSYKIVKWNIDDKNNRYALRETVDGKGRVLKLEFLFNQNGSSLCYLPDIVEYEYESNLIIERLFKQGKEMIALDCEMPYKYIYHLKDNYIEKVESFFKFDTDNYSAEEIKDAKKYIPEHYVFKCDDSTNTEIEYYYYSFAKFNGIYPVNKGYKFEYGNYFYDREPVKKEILKGIEKLKNNR